MKALCNCLFAVKVVRKIGTDLFAASTVVAKKRRKCPLLVCRCGAFYYIVVD